jgi:hypothetical protein
MTGAAHYCHARDCRAEVPPRLFMCRDHWRMVPPTVQRAVLRAYRPGQEQDKRPSPAYLAAAALAVRCVADAEALA